MSTAQASRAGLDAAEAARRLRQHGPNLVPRQRARPPWLMLAKQLAHVFALLLWVAAVLAFIAGMPALSVAIVIVVLLNGFFAFAQEYRADRAAEQLLDLMPAKATVRRDGRQLVVPAAELVPGDVVLLAAGDRISADLRLLTAARLSVDESVLTGESRPARPEAGVLLLAGTCVTEGEAEAEVATTGAGTRLAGIAELTGRATRPPSPLTVRLRRAVTVIGLLAIAVGALFFVVALALGMATTAGFLFAVGVTVALVPEGLLPTVTLSLARAAQLMAARNALVRRLDAVETLGATTFICTDKTGTLTRNEMSVVRVWTPEGTAEIEGDGYHPSGAVHAEVLVRQRVRQLARTAARCSPTAGAELRSGVWTPVGDPMEVALHVLAARAGVRAGAAVVLARHPFDPRRRRSSLVDADGVHVCGAPDAVLPVCRDLPPGVDEAIGELTGRGLRVLAVARRGEVDTAPDPVAVERDLELLGLVGLQDPPRADVAEALAACRAAGIRVAMVTGDHPRTAEAIAAQVGLLGPGRLVLAGKDLPIGDRELGELLDRDGVVIARVTPEDKLRIARALQSRGHVVAMTGDGVNDGPALRAADIGVAMGAGGTDVAREAADLVLLDDHFATIVAAIELGRATFANIRRFLTYHLTDNVAELAPFAVWALSGGSIPLALSVLQVLALDIGTDLLPALALGAEPAGPNTMRGKARTGPLLGGRVLRRAFTVLGPTEALVSMTAFVVILLSGGWTPGAIPDPALLASASGTAFAAVVLGQLANAFTCRSESHPVWRLRWTGNRLLLTAVAVELAVLLAMLLIPPVAELLGGAFPSWQGWLLAGCAIPAVVLADALEKAWRRR